MLLASRKGSAGGVTYGIKDRSAQCPRGPPLSAAAGGGFVRGSSARPGRLLPARRLPADPRANTTRRISIMTALPNPYPVAESVTQFLAKPRRMLIGGQWLEAASGRTFPAFDPAIGEPIAQVAEGA